MKDFPKNAWQSNDYTLPESVRTLISLPEVQLLHYITSQQYTGEGAIIDAGPFLGGSTLALADGLTANPDPKAAQAKVHSYDLFEVFDESQTWGRIGAELGKGSFFHIYEENLGTRREQVEVHKGDILEMNWTGGPIEILFIDIAKTPELLAHIEKTFYPHLIPGKSIVLHQDILHPGTPFIRLSMHHLRAHFTPLDYLPLNTVVYRYEREIPVEKFSAFDYTKLTYADKYSMHHEAIATMPDHVKPMSRLDEVHWLIQQEKIAAAAKKLLEIQAMADHNTALKFSVTRTASRLWPEIFIPKDPIDAQGAFLSNAQLLLISQISEGELLTLYSIAHGIQPSRILEIGQDNGGVLYTLKEALKGINDQQIISLSQNKKSRKIPPALRNKLEKEDNVHFIDGTCPEALPDACSIAGGQFDLIYLASATPCRNIRQQIRLLSTHLTDDGYLIISNCNRLSTKRAIEGLAKNNAIIDCGNLTRGMATSLLNEAPDHEQTDFGGMQLLKKPLPRARKNQKNPVPKAVPKPKRRFWPKLMRSIRKRVKGTQK